MAVVDHTGDIEAYRHLAALARRWAADDTQRRWTCGNKALSVGEMLRWAGEPDSNVDFADTDAAPNRVWEITDGAAEPVAIACISVAHWGVKRLALHPQRGTAGLAALATATERRAWGTVDIEGLRLAALAAGMATTLRQRR